MNKSFITLGGGCFWCTQAVFERVKGVVDTQVGFCNGHTLNPTYAQVCQGDTGHNEVVRLEFDAQQVSLAELLEVFFAIHDPTTFNRQGADVGEQYRSGIYFEHEADLVVVREVLAQAQAFYQGRVVTEIQPLSRFTLAEAEHQHYFAQNPHQGYCAAVIAPKLVKFHQTFQRLVQA